MYDYKNLLEAAAEEGRQEAEAASAEVIITMYNYISLYITTYEFM